MELSRVVLLLKDQSDDAKGCTTMNNSDQGTGTYAAVGERTSDTSPAASQLHAPLFGRIATIESLRDHLQWAIELEHYLLPPYLCALYSLDEGRNPEVTEALTSVLVEEMLHITLSANLLNAMGGRPRLDYPKMLPGYPGCLPHGDRSFEIALFPFGPEAIETFLKIEQPSPTDALPEEDNYNTIGQFYDAIKQGVCELSANLGEANVFCGDPARQVTTQHFGGGRIIAINNLANALAALAEIVTQGEGANHEVWDGDRDVFHPDRDELAHYFRFNELKLGRRYRRGDTPRSGPTGEPISIDWDGVRPMKPNPRTSDHVPGSSIRAAQENFNHSYCTLLQLLDSAFDGAPQMLTSAIGTMYKLKAQARALMQTPSEDGLTTAGPTFEYVASDLRGSAAASR
jgi:hypothetical protein